MEISSFSALDRAWREAKLKSEREHVTPYIWKNTELFKITNVLCETDLSFHRWTLDTPEDFEFIKKIIEFAVEKNMEISLPSILEILRANPDWLKINSQSERNEGYAKSLKQDAAKP